MSDAEDFAMMCAEAALALLLFPFLVLRMVWEWVKWERSR